MTAARNMAGGGVHCERKRTLTEGFFRTVTRRSTLKVQALALALLLVPLIAWGADRVAKPSPGIWPDGIYAWHYNPQNAPAWLDAAQAKAMVQRAARRWESCGLRMKWVADTTRTPGAMDGVNVVGWSLSLPRQVRGLTVGRAANGRLLERDLLFRPDRAEFQRYPRLLEKVLTHEFGHAIGLTHAERCDDVMTLAADCPPIPPTRLPIEPTPNDLRRCQSMYRAITITPGPRAATAKRARSIENAARREQL